MDYQLINVMTSLTCGHIIKFPEKELVALGGFPDSEGHSMENKTKQNKTKTK